MADFKLSTWCHQMQSWQEMCPFFVNMVGKYQSQNIYVPYREGSIGIMWGKELWKLYTCNSNGRWCVEGTPTFNPLFFH